MVMPWVGSGIWVRSRRSTCPPRGCAKGTNEVVVFTQGRAERCRAFEDCAAGAG